jgi:flagellar biosynthesis/type III secretory pathway protein FliH
MGTTREAIVADAPLRGVRVLSRAANADGKTQAKVRWLNSLGEQRLQKEAEAKALQAIAQAVTRAAQQAQAGVAARLEEVAALAVEIGLAVAREVIGEAADAGRADPTPTVVHCLRDCVHGVSDDDLVVRLHPEDLALVQQRLAAMPELAEAVASSRLLGDPAMARGAVRAETGAGRLRYDPREAFERVAAAVRSAAQEGSA